MTTSTLTAIRVEIKLGNMTLEVFQMPNGEYRLSQTQILEAIEVKKNWLGTVTARGDKSLGWLQGEGFTGSQIKASVKIERGSTTVQTLSINDSVCVWGYFVASHGNKLASSLLMACAAEAIERRADAQLGINRSETERNARLAARVNSKEAFYWYGDTVKGWLDKNHSDWDERKKGFYYALCQDTINKLLFDKTAKTIREELQVHNLLRDHYGRRSLVRLGAIQESAANKVRKGADPVSALKLTAIENCYDAMSYKM